MSQPIAQPVSLRRAPALALALATALLISACSAGPAPTPTPRPDQPCGGADEQVATGFYPDLEALLPRTLDGEAPSQRNSGRYCSAVKLGTLYTRDGIHEVHFAGAVWPDRDGTSGISTVVFRASGLTVDNVADSYALAANDSRNVTRVSSDATPVAGRPGVRLQVFNQDAIQLVQIWAGRQPETIDIVLGSEVDQARFDRAVTALEGT